MVMFVEDHRPLGLPCHTGHELDTTLLDYIGHWPRQGVRMSSSAEQAWDMISTSADAKKTSAYATRVKEILNGSKPGQTRSTRATRSSTKHKGVSRAHINVALGVSSIVVPSTPRLEISRNTDCTVEARKLEPTTTEFRSAEDAASTFTAGWLKNINGAADVDVNIRKAALRSLSQDLCNVIRRFSDAGEGMQNAASTANVLTTSSAFLEDLMSALMDNLARTLFKALADPSEVCRESALRAVIVLVDHVPDLTPHLAYLFPIVMARGVPPGSLYDAEVQLFIHDIEAHDAYKRGKATERQDRRIPLVQSVAEGSEELRLVLCQLVEHIFSQLTSRGTVGVLRPYLDDAVLFLVTQFRDPFSPVKVEALGIISMLALQPSLEQGMKFYAVGLARATLPLLRHRHAKVRLAALEALWVTVKVPDRAKVKGAGTAAIVDLVGFREDNVLPIAAFYGKGDTTINYLAELTRDQSVAVRQKTASMLGDWLTALPDRYDHQTRLLPYVLNTISDEAEIVSAIALETLSRCGVEYESEHQDEVIERRQFGVDGDVRANHTKPLPAPFSGRPRIGTRLYVRKNTRRFLLPLLTELSDWISHTRLQSARLFRTLIVFCEEHLTVEAHKLIPYLQRALDLAASAKDNALEGVLLDCCELLGRYLVPESYLPHILSRIKEEQDTDPGRNRAALLTILLKLVEGTLPKVLLPHISDIVEAVTARREDIAAEIIHVRCATIRVLAAIANAMGRGGQRATLEATYLKTGRLASIRRPVQSIVEYLLVCGSLGDVQSEVVSCLSDLADAHRATDIETFVADHAQALVEFVSQDYPVGPGWNRACTAHLVLEGLLSMCPQAPRICPCVSTNLLGLCSQVVNRINNFMENEQETVLASLVGVVLLRMVNAWESARENEQSKGSEYNVVIENNARTILDLGLHPCWSKSPRLRKVMIDFLAALAHNMAWRGFMSSRPQEASIAVMNIRNKVIDLLGHPQTSSESAGVLLETISPILRTSGFLSHEFLSHVGQLLPFSKRKGSDSNTQPLHDHRSFATELYPLVLARLHDNTEFVRIRAVETLGDFLHVISPDEARNGRQSSELAEHDRECSPDCKDISRTEDRGNQIGNESTTFRYTPFVSACIELATRVTTTGKFADELDALLRKAACLDPQAFGALANRFSRDCGLARSSVQMLSELSDHSNLLLTLRQTR